MSLGEDVRQDMYCNEAEEDALRRGKLWKTASGEIIPIDEMTDEHLLNAHRFMREKKNRITSYILLHEIEKRDLEPLVVREKDGEVTYS